MKKKNENTLYAFITGDPIKHGSRRDILLKSVKATDKTKISVLGHDNHTLEYRPDVDGESRFEQTEDGLSISVFRGQRIYNDRKWPNPMVVKLEHIARAFN